MDSEELSRLRATAFQHLKAGDVKAAYQVMADLLRCDDSSLDDLYVAGEWALDSGNYADARVLFCKVLSASMSEKDDWYRSSAHLGRAYASAMLGDYGSATADIANIGDDDCISWLGHHSEISKASLMAIIQQRQSESKGAPDL